MLIKSWSKRLIGYIEKGYSTTNLKRMRQFYIIQKGAPVVNQLTWMDYITTNKKLK